MIVKKIIIVIAFLFFAVICWRLVSAWRHAPPPIPYSTFLQVLEEGRIQKATILMGSELADVQFSRRGSSAQDTTEVPTKELPLLIKKMIDCGVAVEFSKAQRAEPGFILLNLMPVFLIPAAIAYLYFAVRRKQA